MTDTQDLVERLRGCPPGRCDSEYYYEAADRLQSLQARVAELEGALGAFVAAYDNEDWPIENDIGLFENARAMLAAAGENDEPD